MEIQVHMWKPPPEMDMYFVAENLMKNKKKDVQRK